MGNYKILFVTKTILNIYWYFQIVLIAAILFVGLSLWFNFDFINLNYLNGFNIHFSKIIFPDQLVFNGANYDFTLTNGGGRLHINDLDQKFVYLRILAALIDSIIYLMIIYFLRKIFKNLTENRYFIRVNGMYIKKIAISILVLAIVPQIIQYITDIWIVNSIEIKNIIFKDEFNFKFETILLGLLVFVISIIFLRGIELKEDQDLTI